MSELETHTSRTAPLRPPAPAPWLTPVVIPAMLILLLATLVIYVLAAQ